MIRLDLPASASQTPLIALLGNFALSQRGLFQVSPAHLPHRDLRQPAAMHIAKSKHTSLSWLRPQLFIASLRRENAEIDRLAEPSPWSSCGSPDNISLCHASRESYPANSISTRRTSHATFSPGWVPSFPRPPPLQPQSSQWTSQQPSISPPNGLTSDNCWTLGFPRQDRQCN
ncbi:hypothetical protein V2G26_006538 [Clonostachys chloroleuca]